LLKLHPRRHELAEFLGTGLLLNELLSEEIREQRVGQFSIDLNFLPFHGETVSLMIELISEPVIPFDLAKVNATQLRRSVSF
jgi:hypothetical protein